jgi:tetratricopeptide (TPR) repeat protein
MKYEIAKIFQNYIQNEQKAIQYYEQALEVFESLNNLNKAAEIRNNLGDIYVTKELFDLALTNFIMAKKFYAELEDEYNKNLVLGKINSLKEIEPNSFSP